MKKRQGFTLVELMIVIVVIALLIALLTPAVIAAVRKARLAEVQSEISQIEYALEDFKAHFGIYPPSHFDFRLYNPPDYDTPVLTGATLHPETQATLRRLWPNINMAGLVKDLQDNPVKQKFLDGPQCLVFFLGGIVPTEEGNPMGFSNNPRSPLSIPTAGPELAAAKRIGPFFEFQGDRLYDANPTTFDGYEGYLDTLPGQTKPYHYITSKDYLPKSPTDPMPFAYRSGFGTFFNQQKYQIISAGLDFEYGQPSVFDTEEAAFVSWADPTDPSSTKTFTTDGTGADDITNFHSGPLIP